MKKNLLSILERPSGVTHRLITTASCEAAVQTLLDDEHLHGCEVVVMGQQVSNETQQLDQDAAISRLEETMRELESHLPAPVPTGHSNALLLLDSDGVVNGDAGTQATVTALVEQSLSETPRDVTVGILPLPEQVDAEDAIAADEGDVEAIAATLESFGFNVLRGRDAVTTHLRS